MAFVMGRKDGRLTDSIDTFVANMTDAHRDVRSRVAGRLKELDFRIVGDLASKSSQFFQRELGVEAARHVSDALGRYYHVTLTDVQARQRAPGDPPCVDKSYSTPKFE